MQTFVHQKGYEAKAEIEGKQARLYLWKNGKKVQKGDLVPFASLPKVFEEKYKALYDFLKNGE